VIKNIVDKCLLLQWTGVSRYIDRVMWIAANQRVMELVMPADSLTKVGEPNRQSLQDITCYGAYVL